MSVPSSMIAVLVGRHRPTRTPTVCFTYAATVGVHLPTWHIPDDHKLTIAYELFDDFFDHTVAPRCKERTSCGLLTVFPALPKINNKLSTTCCTTLLVGTAAQKDPNIGERLCNGFHKFTKQLPYNLKYGTGGAGVRSCQNV